LVLCWLPLLRSSYLQALQAETTKKKPSTVASQNTTPRTANGSGRRVGSEMTDNLLIEAVLKSCGWSWKSYKENSFSDPSKTIKHLGWHNPRGILCRGSMVPPILTSLDACHEVFEYSAPDRYWWHLARQQYHGANEWSEAIAMCKATPRQRCEAWLKFKGITI